MNFDSESQEWFRQAKNGVNPFGIHENVGGLILLTKVVDRSHYPARRIGVSSEALLVLRFLNPSVKPAPFRVKCGFCGTNAELLDDEVARGRVRETPPGAILMRKRTLSRNFRTTQIGVETAVAFRTRVECSESEFEIVSGFINDSERGKGTMQRDWLGLVAEVVKGLPGGQIVLGPLMRLRDDERLAKRLQAVDESISQKQALSEERLEELFDGLAETLIDEVSFDIAKACISGLVINEITQTQRSELVEVKRIPNVTGFPIPMQSKHLIQEFEAQFGNDFSLLSDELKLVDYDEIPTSTTPVDFYFSFVKGMRGKDRDVLIEIFDRLVRRRPSSEIFRFVLESLSQASNG